MDVLDMLVFFKLHPSEMFDKYLQVYLKKESEPGIEEQKQYHHPLNFLLHWYLCSQPPV